MADNVLKIGGNTVTSDNVFDFIETLTDSTENSDTNSDYNNSDTDNESEHSDHDTVSEIDGSDLSSDEDGTTSNSETNFYYGRNRYKWSKNPPAPSKVRAQNIISHLPGLRGPALQTKPCSPLESWLLLITPDMLACILEHTNEKITELSVNYGSNCTFVDHLSEAELKAFLGLIYLSGVLKSNHESVDSLFSTSSVGRPIFRATMSKERFLFLLSAIRFDNHTLRDQKKATGDRLAAVSYLFNAFISNSIANYTCSEYVTVDEMLVGFRGRCPFRMYIKAKPVKYGIKIMCLCDSKTHYLVNAFVYTGKTNDPNPQRLSIPTRSVLALVEPISNSNRNVTGDNWFTSLELVDELKKLRLTYVGTMRKNKREIPQPFQPNKNYEVNKCLFGFTRDNTIASYVPKKNKSVIMLSTMHHCKSIDQESKKPEIVVFYNATKGGVDALDQKCALYRSGRRCRRWPLVIWYAIMDIAIVNSHIIFLAANPGIRKNRSDFIQELGISLINEHLKVRAKIPNLSRELRSIISKTLGTEIDQDQTRPQRPVGRRRCYLCPRGTDIKHSTFCFECHRNVCKMHAIQKVTCTSCKE